jgi:hypothetical protein
MLNTRRAIKAASVLPLLLCAALSSCCKREVQARHPPPSEAKVLSVVRVNCAGFDSFRTEVRLGDAAATARASGGEVVARISKSPVVQVTWVDESSMVVFVPKEYHVDVQKKELEGVRIEFR